MLSRCRMIWLTHPVPLSPKFREYWMIYWGTCFLAVVWFGSHTPSPYPPRCLFFLSFLVCRRSSLLTGKGKGGWEVVEPSHTTARKPGALQIIQYSPAKFIQVKISCPGEIIFFLYPCPKLRLCKYNTMHQLFPPSLLKLYDFRSLLCTKAMLPLTLCYAESALSSK